MNPIEVVDSHTGGEPTRVVVSGGPDLGRGSMADRVLRFKSQHDDFRSAVVNEPRGSDTIVGALLCDPVDPGSLAGVIFFNNVGILGMCGHGMIGVVATLKHLGRIRPGDYRFETPVGTVTASLHDSGNVSVANVPSYRSAKDVGVDVEGIGRVTGDVAWGGNWFFLVEKHGQRLDLANVEALTAYAGKLRRAVNVAHPEVDHIELFGPSARADSRNFVLCPGGAYDRSPCGTGTSAKLACLVADGKLKEGGIWRQEGIVGSIFEGSVRIVGGVVHPTIKGTAFITAQATLLRDPRDPFAAGIRRDL
jgi:4-hydroxyproline epimerase